MTEFTKLKITFALALLGTLFALHPLLDRFADWGFLYLGYDLKVFYAYSLTSGLLSLCVYLYAVTLLNDHPHSWCERTGNSTYALAILVVPIYAGLYLSAKLAEQVAVSHVAWAAPLVAVGLGAGWIVLSQMVAWRIRRRLGEQDRVVQDDATGESGNRVAQPGQGALRQPALRPRASSRRGGPSKRDCGRFSSAGGS